MICVVLLASCNEGAIPPPLPLPSSKDWVPENYGVGWPSFFLANVFLFKRTPGYFLIFVTSVPFLFI